MFDIELGSLALATIAATAFLVGFSKTGMPGAGILAAPLMALFIPAKESVGALLPILIVGDLIAITIYRRHAEWSEIRKLALPVACGMLLGWYVLSWLDNAAMKPVLGGLILGLLAIEILKRRVKLDSHEPSRLFSAEIGGLAGCATTLGNAAGPVMSIYLVSMRLEKTRFLGTAAWFFLIVNCTKIPIYVNQGMLGVDNLVLPVIFLPLVLIGALYGRVLAKSLSQKSFDWLVLVLAGVAALWLLAGDYVLSFISV